MDVDDCVERANTLTHEYIHRPRTVFILFRVCGALLKYNNGGVFEFVGGWKRIVKKINNFFCFFFGFCFCFIAFNL